MSRLLPFKSEPTKTPDGAKVLSLEDDATEEALSALSSETAREILSLVYEEPRTPPEVRDEVDSSLQNVHYHLENLEEAGLVQPAGSGYSEKGTEMTVYAPASEAVVLFAGQERDRSRLKTAISRLLGAIGLLALASLVVRRAARTAEVVSSTVSQGGGTSGDTDAAADRQGPESGEDGGGGGDGGGDGLSAQDAGTNTTSRGETTTEAVKETYGSETVTPTEGLPDTAAATGTPTPAGTPDPTATPTAAPSPTPVDTGTPTEVAMGEATATQRAVDTAVPSDLDVATTPPSGTPEPAVTEGAAGITDGGLLADPAVAFFLGGLFMLVVVTAWWYYTG